MAPALAAAITGLVALAVYGLSAARTITWWDGSTYPLAAATFGVAPAPGSLLLTLLGGFIAHLPSPLSVALRLNLLAALIGAATAAGVAWIGATLAKRPGRDAGGVELTAGVFAGLAFALAFTPWTYAVQFTPYGLTAFFTVLILATALAWWDRADAPEGPARLGLLFLLVGLDFSVHRTNLLLLPGVAVWIALSRPRAHRIVAGTFAAVAAFGAGLATQLFLIPLSARDPAFNMEEPHNLERLWNYVSMSEKGGGFLVNLFPRRADFLSVQLADLVHALRVNLWASEPAWLVIVPIALLGYGVFLAWRDAPGRTAGLIALFLSAGLGAVVYFNRPEYFFRPLDRHYLPAFVILMPLMAVGIRGLLEALLRVPETGRLLAPSALAALALVPIANREANVRACDLSRVRFAATLSRDVLATLPPDAILITNGDNDTMPLWYLQRVEGYRRDVTVINLSLANTTWFVDQLGRRDSSLAGLAAAARARRAMRSDSTAVIRVDPRADLGLPPDFVRPDSLVLRPTFGPALPGSPSGDEVALALLDRFGFRRPLCLAITLAPENLSWLQPYARPDGLAYRIVPTADSSVQDLEGLRHQLLEVARYEGIADPRVPMDETSQLMCRNEFGALLLLATRQFQAGDPDGCLATLDFQAQKVPLDRLGAPAKYDPTIPLRRAAEHARDEREGALSR